MRNLFFGAVISIVVNTMAFGQSDPVVSESLIKLRKAELTKLASQWSRGGYSNDSAFVNEHSDDPLTQPVIFHEGTFPEGNSMAFTSAKRGDVLGPFVCGNTVGIYRYLKSDRCSDSAQVTHIWVADKTSPGAPYEIKRSKKEAKKRADSICNVIRSGKVQIENIVTQFTDDPGSMTGNNGNYGWFTAESAFVTEFKEAGLTMPVDSTFVIETVFGYHVIQVEARTKEHQCYHAWEVVKVIDTCYTVNGEMRTFPAEYIGGPTALEMFVFSNGRGNVTTLGSPPYEAIVLVWFTVEVDGTVSGVDVFNDEFLDPAIVEESARIVQLLTQWKPAYTCDGPVSSRTMVVLYY